MSVAQYSSDRATIAPDESGPRRARMRDAPAVGDRYRAANTICRRVELVGAALILVRSPAVPGPCGVAPPHRPGRRDSIDRRTPPASRGFSIEREGR